MQKPYVVDNRRRAKTAYLWSARSALVLCHMGIGGKINLPLEAHTRLRFLSEWIESFLARRPTLV